ncbi:MAG: MATE family efflux transporter [SAR86 cluster bacterium]|uniref:MATE family efflux transporter n=1 Tax=SAR86 cluster bacterium TaxID=2030880 RepID=A0A2A4X8H7_9GAMM|nr:MAG: MATE family efflux transporter [SAR86 cluster bacterium]
MHKEILHRAWPIILSGLSVPLLGAVDTAVIGHLPEASYLGAVAIGAMIMSFLYWGFGFLRMGTTGFVAQAAGANDGQEIRTVLAQSLLLGLLISLTIIVLQVPILKLALNLVSSNMQVEQGASTYFNYRVWGAPAVLFNYTLLGFFIGLGNTRAVLFTQIFMNVVNIALDLVFVIWLGLDIQGVALASVIAEYSAVFVGFVLVVKELRRIGGAWIKSSILSVTKAVKLLKVNLDIFIRTILLIFSFAYFTAEAAKIGEEALAATAVLMNFMHFLAFGLDGFAHAAEGLVGAAIGARKESRLKQVVLVSSFWACCVALLYSLIYGIFGVSVVNLLTNIEDVRTVAYTYLPWLVLMPLVSVWAYQLDGIFVGAMQSKEMRNGMILSALAYFIAVHFLGEIWGMHGLWAALAIFMAMRGITLGIAYPRVKRAALTSIV